jgi:hypothetical protein
MKTNLYAIAHARSGDKGDTVNVGVRARRPEFYDLLRSHLTAERVKAHFGELVKGGVERYELPNLHALNFLMHEALGGGGTVSLMTDAQGKTFSTALLRMEIELPEELAALVDEALLRAGRSVAGEPGAGAVAPGAPASGAAPSGTTPSGTTPSGGRA